MRASRHLRIALLTALGLGSMLGCEDRNEYQPPPDAPVTVATPITGEVIDVIETDGVIAGLQQVEIRAQVQGTITGIHFEDGQEVSEGDPLFTIDPGPYRADVLQARANLRTRRAAADFARSSLERATNLHSTGAMSDQQFDEVRQTNIGTIAQVAEAQAAMQRAEIDLGYTNVVSPIDGTMSRRAVDRGTLVGTAGDATLLASVVNSTAVYAEFTLSQNEVLSVRAKARAAMERHGIENPDDLEIPVLVRLADEEGFPHRGVLDSIENTLNSTTGTLAMRALMQNPGNTLLPGLFARIRLPIGRTEGILVPELALTLDQVGRFVYIVTDENDVERRNVTIASQHEGALVRVEGGLEGDERVVINGMARVRVGSHVEPTEGEIEAPPSLFDESQLEEQIRPANDEATDGGEEDEEDGADEAATGGD